MITLLLAVLLAVAEAAGLISILIWLLILAVVVWVVYMIIGFMKIPEPIGTIICVIVGLIILLLLVQRLGLL